MIMTLAGANDYLNPSFPNSPTCRLMERLSLKKTRAATPTPNYVAHQSTYGKQNARLVVAVGLLIRLDQGVGGV
jgi:hypothetical protein